MSFESLLAQVNGPPTPTQALNFLLSCCSKKVNIHAYKGANEGYDGELQPSFCESIGELLSSFPNKIHLSDAAIDTITVMFAVAISLEISGPFIWMHITGPSSSLKTTILELIGAAYDRVYSVTNFTSFYSGSTFGGRDNSLLPKIQGKLFIIKDLTPMLQADRGVQDTVFGQLRDIYDGNGNKFFNNGVNLDYRGVRFVCLTGVTYVIHKFSRTDMGERFLICDIDSSWTDTGENVQMATDTSVEGNAWDAAFDTMSEGFDSEAAPKLDNLKDQRCMAWGLLNHFFESMQDETHGLKALTAVFRADRVFKAEVDGLATWMEHARCKIPPKSDRDTIRPVPAKPHRSIKQLAKLALGLAIVTKSIGPTADIKRLVRKVAFDSSFSLTLEVMNLLATFPEITKNDLAARVRYSPTQVATVCDHLVTISVAERRIKNSGGVGQPNACWVLTPKFRAIADIIGLPAKRIKVETPAEGLMRIFPAKAPIFGRKME